MLCFTVSKFTTIKKSPYSNCHILGDFVVAWNMHSINNKFWFQKKLRKLSLALPLSMKKIMSVKNNPTIRLRILAQNFTSTCTLATTKKRLNDHGHLLFKNGNAIISKRSKHYRRNWKNVGHETKNITMKKLITF
jgi:hypothetical protein